MNILITGAAGFIGSNMCDFFIDNGDKVIALDNLSLGSENNIKHLYKYKNFNFINMDVTNTKQLDEVFMENDIDVVFHLAANSDIQKSSKDPSIDLKNTFLTTYSVSECMRRHNVKKLVFASTSAVYGKKEEEKIYEDIGPLFPISYYGAGKLSSEAFISAYTYMNDFTTCIFRFPNVIGERLTHGVIFDFIKKLRKNPDELEILGDGNQEKSYIYVKDLIGAIMFVFKNATKGINYFNVGGNGTTKVKEIADIICEEMNLKNVNYKYTGGKVGWKGDVSKFEYNTSKINNYGWKAKYTSNEAVKLTVRSVLKD